MGVRDAGMYARGWGRCGLGRCSVLFPRGAQVRHDDAIHVLVSSCLHVFICDTVIMRCDDVMM